MRTKSVQKNSRHAHGFSLLELLVAMALSIMVVTLVFFSWNYITRHTITQQQKSLFQAEADRVAHAIALEIRKSPEVISWKNDKIVFISSNGPDTITYEFSNGNLLKNEAVVPCNAQTAHITSFSLEGDAVKGQLPVSNSVGLVVTLGMEDGFGNSSTVPLHVRANFPLDRQDSLTRKWNF